MTENFLLQEFQEEPKILKGYYNKENKEYFCFYSKIENNYNLAKDLITGENIDLKTLYTTGFEVTWSEFKYFKGLYEIYSNKNIFEVKTEENYSKNIIFLNVLRFFDLKDYTVLFEKESSVEDIKRVVEKIKKYTQRYIGEENSKVFSEQLLKYNSIFDILTLIPQELLDKNMPFWIYDMKTHQEQFICVCSLEELKNCNKYDFKLKEIWEDNTIIQKRIEEIIENDKQKHKDKCLFLLKGKINDAKLVLANEIEEAKKCNDEDLLKEIEIINEEFNEIEKALDHIDFEQSSDIWWPSILYPLITVIKEDSNADFQVLGQMFDYNPRYL